jgi:formylglycine-generating enzyme required for sulfatase activity
MQLFTFTDLDGGTVRFCVDETEVSAAQYDAFVAAAGGDVSKQDSRCVGINTSFAGAELPQKCTYPPGGSPSLPVTCLDWCDALAYCTGAGKPLCGLVGGGTLNASTTSIQEGEWFKACSSNNPGFYVYPYGATYVPGDCNGADLDAGAPLPVGMLKKCTTPAGILDLSGNVAEFVDVLTNGTYGHWMGGSFDAGAPGLQCSSDDHDYVTRGFPDVGFRCCANP